MHSRCGTKNGYDYHKRALKDEPCEPCVEAMRKYFRDRRKLPEVKERYRIYNRTNRKVRNGSRFRRFSKDYDMKRDFFSVNTVLETYGTDCHLCGGPIDLNAPRLVGRPGWEMSLHIDHVVPMSRGGDDTLENVRPAHGKCNVVKHNSMLENVATE